MVLIGSTSGVKPMKPRGKRARKKAQGQSPHTGAASIDGRATTNLPQFETFFSSALMQGKGVGPPPNLQAWQPRIQVKTRALLNVYIPAYLLACTHGSSAGNIIWLGRVAAKP